VEKKMRTRYLLPIILIVIILSLVIYLYLHQKAQEPISKSTGPSKWLLSDPSLLQSITLENPTGKIGFQKNDQGWWELTEPYTAELDFDLLQLFIDEIAISKRERIVEQNPEDLSVYQLDDPPFKLTMKLTGRSEPKIYYFGKLNPSLDRIYTREQGHPEVFLIRRGLYMYLPKSFNNFRLKIILPLPKEDISRFSIEIFSPELKKELQQAIDPLIVKQVTPEQREAWNIIEPIQEKADSGKVDKLLGSITFQVSSNVMDLKDDLKVFGLDKPQAAVHVTTDEGAIINLLFGKSSPEGNYIYAWDQVRKEVFSFPYKVFVDIMNTDFRIHKLLPKYPYQHFSKISVEFPSSPENNYSIMPTTETNRWKAEAVPSKTFPRRRVRWVLKSLMDSEFERYIYQKPFPLSDARLDPPRAVIELYMNTQKPAYQFAVGQSDEYGNTYVLDQINNELVQYNLDVIYELPPDVKNFFITRKPSE
jgi:hypothetical protein